MSRSILPFVERSSIMVSMNRLSTEKRAQIIASLVEGNSIRATVRMTGAAKNTVVKLLTDLGAACAEYQDEALRDLPCANIQCDEIWAFCYSKAKNVPQEHRGTFGYGDVWTWTAICADTKLVPSWLVGERTTCRTSRTGSPTACSSPPTATAPTSTPWTSRSVTTLTSP
jgi:hypothetical protein